MQSINVVTRSNANVVACSPSNLLGQQAFSGRELIVGKEPPHGRRRICSLCYRYDV